MGGREWRAVVWPVSWLVRGLGMSGAVRWPGEAWPFLPGPCGSGLAPRTCPARDPRWQVGKEPHDAAPPTYLYGQRQCGGAG
jgi:hypothetical protein